MAERNGTAEQCENHDFEFRLAIGFVVAAGRQQKRRHRHGGGQQAVAE